MYDKSDEFIDFIIIGGQKCASTFVQNVINEHPQVYLHPGEVAFFQNPDYNNNNISDLIGLFSEVKEGSKIGIKRPDYLAKPECASRIKKDFPNAKLIATLRNPIDRAIAAYYHYINDGFIPPLKIEVGLKKILNSELKEFPRSEEVIEYGYYYKHLSHYLTYFKRDQILILSTDELKDPIKLSEKIYSFLEVDCSFISKRAFRRRPQKVIYSHSLLKVVSLKNKVNYTYNPDRTRLYPKYSTSIGKLRYKAINWLSHQAALSPLNKKEPTVEKWVKDTLRELYMDDILSLEQLLHRNFSQWYK